MLRPYLVDTHCHVGDAAFDADRDAVLARARAAGVTHVVVIGESLAGSERAAALTRGTSGLSASAGVHPHEAREWSDTARERVRELLAAPAMVAVGETGLDYHYMHAPREIQRNAFAGQLELATELGKPVIVHAREAAADAAAPAPAGPRDARHRARAPSRCRHGRDATLPAATSACSRAAQLLIRGRRLGCGASDPCIFLVQRHDHLQELDAAASPARVPRR